MNAQPRYFIPRDPADMLDTLIRQNDFQAEALSNLAPKEMLTFHIRNGDDLLGYEDRVVAIASDYAEHDLARMQARPFQDATGEYPALDWTGAVRHLCARWDV